MLYRIKPLEWEDFDGIEFSAHTVFGWWFVRQRRKGWFVALPDARPINCDSPEDGKAKAEAHYRERLMAALEPVQAITVGEPVIRPVFPIGE